jgi:hypothetical protein
VLQNTLLQQLHMRLTGPHAVTTIRRIRESVAYLHQLDPERQATVIACYTVAFRATFVFISLAGGLTLLSTLLGLQRAQPPKEDEEVI